MKGFITLIAVLLNSISLSYPVRSIISSRMIGIIGEGEHDVTASSYVQDGLIAMWDGIENSGWKYHNSEAVIWKDLIGDNDLNIYGTVLSNGIKNISLPAATRSGVLEGVMTIEVCYYYPGGVINYGIMFCCSDLIDRNHIGLIHYGINSTGYQTYSNVFWDYSMINSEGGRTICATSSNCYVDATKIGLKSHSEDIWHNQGYHNIGIGGRGGSGFICPARYYSVRVYNRDLNDEEVQYNHLIDKLRFGI